MRISRLLPILVVCMLAAAAAFAAPAQVSVDRVADLSAAAAALVPGETLVVAGLALDGAAEGTVVSIELERFDVFAPDATIVVNGENGREVLPAPNNHYLRGAVAGQPDSRAHLTILEEGEPRGLMQVGATLYVLGIDGGQLVTRTVDPAAFAEETSEFSCGTDALGDPQTELSTLLPPANPKIEPAAITEGVTHTARVAVETDQEFLSLFGGNTTLATNYIGDLLGFSSTIYETEVDTNFLVSHIELWTTTDPWNQFGTTCGLMELGNYWNDNNDGIERSITHFMSGKNNGGGVAWVGVLCSDEFNVTLSQFGLVCSGMPDTGNYGGHYGYSGDMDGNFSLGLPGVVWDIVVVSHEIGHNFNSPHSHCYGNLGGNTAPVDTCYAGQCGGAGCHCGGTSLPGPSGTGSGTIMSYCHLLSPGITNIGFSFGQGHPFGTAPERVPSRMRDHVLATAAGDPSCLAFEPPLESIFTDGFESGDTSSWSSTVN